MFNELYKLTLKESKPVVTSDPDVAVESLDVASRDLEKSVEEYDRLVSSESYLKNIQNIIATTPTSVVNTESFTKLYQSHMGYILNSLGSNSECISHEGVIGNTLSTILTAVKNAIGAILRFIKNVVMKAIGLILDAIAIILTPIAAVLNGFIGWRLWNRLKNSAFGQLAEGMKKAQSNTSNESMISQERGDPMRTATDIYRRAMVLAIMCGDYSTPLFGAIVGDRGQTVLNVTEKFTKLTSFDAAAISPLLKEFFKGGILLNKHNLAGFSGGGQGLLDVYHDIVEQINKEATSSHMIPTTFYGFHVDGKSGWGAISALGSIATGYKADYEIKAKAKVLFENVDGGSMMPTSTGHETKEFEATSKITVKLADIKDVPKAEQEFNKVVKEAALRTESHARQAKEAVKTFQTKLDVVYKDLQDLQNKLGDGITKEAFDALKVFFRTINGLSTSLTTYSQSVINGQKTFLKGLKLAHKMGNDFADGLKELNNSSN